MSVLPGGGLPIVMNSRRFNRPNCIAPCGPGTHLQDTELARISQAGMPDILQRPLGAPQNRRPQWVISGHCRRTSGCPHYLRSAQRQQGEAFQSRASHPILSPNWNIDRDQHCWFDSGPIWHFGCRRQEDRSRLLNNLEAALKQAVRKWPFLTPAAEAQSAGTERRSQAEGGEL